MSGTGTSKTVIVDIANEDRRYFHTIGANAGLSAAALEQARWEPGDILYVGGYLVLPGVEGPALAGRLRAARAAGARTVLDVCVPSGAAVSFADVEEVLPEVDFFLPNEDEGLALTGITGPAGQAEAFLAAGAGTVVITCGHAGALMATPARQAWLAAPAVDAVDSSGAGDAFAAGFISGVLEGWPDDKKLIFASVVGASACTALGCTAGVFSRAQAEEYIAHHTLTLA
jgi:sugar/nucleoside kinase (ribokinase family)